MITADIIKCFIPSENALKVSELFCDVAYPVSSANSQTWATWAGVVVTAIALLFAGSAWREARDANGIAMSQLEKSVEGVEEQIKAQRRTALEQMQLEQLGKFCEALISFVDNARHISENLRPDLESGVIADMDGASRAVQIEMEERKREIKARWTSWAMYIIGDDQKLRDATNNHLTGCIAAAEDVLGQEINRLAMASYDPSEMRDSFANLAILRRLETLFEETANYVVRLQQVMLNAPRWKQIRLELIAEFSIPSEAKEASGKGF